MKIGEEHLIGPQHCALVQLRLFHFDDQFGVGEYSFRRRDNRRAGLLIIRIRHSDTGAGIRFHDDVMAIVDEFPNTCRHHANTELEGLDLFGDADFHSCFSRSLFLGNSAGYLRIGAIYLPIG